MGVRGVKGVTWNIDLGINMSGVIVVGEGDEAIELHLHVLKGPVGKFGQRGGGKGRGTGRIRIEKLSLVEWFGERNGVSMSQPPRLVGDEFDFVLIWVKHTMVFLSKTLNRTTKRYMLSYDSGIRRPTILNQVC